MPHLVGIQVASHGIQVVLLLELDLHLGFESSSPQLRQTCSQINLNATADILKKKKRPTTVLREADLVEQ